jgi:hypothetical protein
VTIPDYWLQRPEFELTKAHQEKLEHLWASLEFASIPWIENLPVPEWVFLCWLVEEKNVLLHGSSNPNISLFEPRAPNAKDDDEFSQQTAVFAASDGIWPMCYAILDRENFHPRFMNGAVRFELPSFDKSLGSNGLSDTRYFFSITKNILENYPWRDGVMYVLPKDGFVLQPPHPLGDCIIHEFHWANLNAVKPLAKLRISPEDFPFLGQVRGHDNAVIEERMKVNPARFPWLDE